MIPLTVREIAHIVGGDIHGDADAVVAGPAVVDSRQIGPGNLFIAIAGEHVDGHDFVDAALAAGAAATLCQRPVTGPCIVVPDPLAAVGELARATLAKLRNETDLRVVALTGSQGKTSVKDLLAHIFEADGPTVAPTGSFNNELGVPLTVLRATTETKWLVLEMGARGEGHISYLCSIAPPDVAAVLNVGSAHLGEFGSVAQIAQAKGEIVEALGPDGIAVLNADDPHVAAMRSRGPQQIVTFGESDDVRLVEPPVLNDDGQPQFVVGINGVDWPVTVPQIGFHHGINATAAFAIASACGIEPAAIVRALRTATARSAMRMEAVRTPAGTLILNDAYNANPESMAAGLKTLISIAKGRSIAVLGAMLELGAESEEQHRLIGELAVTLGVDQVVVVGEGARAIAAGAGDRAQLFGSKDEATKMLRASLLPSDTVLVKASRSIQLEELVAVLMTA